MGETDRNKFPSVNTENNEGTQGGTTTSAQESEMLHLLIAYYVPGTLLSGLYSFISD